MIYIYIYIYVLLLLVYYIYIYTHTLLYNILSNTITYKGRGGRAQGRDGRRRAHELGRPLYSTLLYSVMLYYILFYYITFYSILF